jgi:hypothetical protein
LDAGLSPRREERLRAKRAPQSEATGSRRSKPFLKNLDFQIYSKYYQAFGLELKAISRFSVWISKFFL